MRDFVMWTMGGAAAGSLIGIAYSMDRLIRALERIANALESKGE